MVISTHDLVPAPSGGLLKRYTDWGRGEHRREWTILQALSGAVPGLVPSVSAADLDADPPWIAMTRLAGTPLSGALTASQLAGLEAAVRRLWSVPAGDLPLRRFHPAQARSVIGSGLAAAVRPAGVAGEAFDLCRSFLAGPSPSPWPLAGAVIGHGDANLANYLWDGSSVRIVDFEDAGASEPAYELGFLVEHLSGRATDWAPLLSRFAGEVDADRLRHARLTSAAHWLLLLLPGGPADRRNPPGTLAAQARRILTQLA
jgi:aminoglycoside phosphotransferase